MTVKRLDEEVINKIAAGEVIERPASVVKELLENSIDAGSGRIEVDVRNGGVRYIRVVDNGCGMSPEDMRLAFEAHTTSKIRDIRDLERIATLGFRGEALSSIASVSRVRAQSRPHDKDDGYELVIEGGKYILDRPVGCAPGTMIEVRDLFFNVPARRKFLKTRATETRHIVRMVQNLALAHPEIAFTLYTDGGTVLTTSGSGDLFESICAVFGLELAEKLLFVRVERGDYHLVGFVAPPTVTRGDRSWQIAVVNGRVIRSPLVYQALDQGFKPTLPPRRNAVCVLSISLPPEDLDVNVHPAKTEVRFKNRDGIFSLIRSAVEQALTGGNTLSFPRMPKRERSDLPKPKGGRSFAEGKAVSTIEAQSKRAREEVEPGQAVREQNLFGPASLAFTSEWRIVGQVQGTYIIAEQGEKLIVIDQHAAHERIIYEKLREKKAGSQAQPLLVPVHVKVDKATLLQLEENREVLKNLGFKLEPFGEGSYIIRSVPAVLSRLSGEKLREIVLDLLAGKDRDVVEPAEAFMIKISCQAAVKAGKKLDYIEMERLVSDLFSTSRPYTCPHGRPTVLEVEEKALERAFRRR